MNIPSTDFMRRRYRDIPSEITLLVARLLCARAILGRVSPIDSVFLTEFPSQSRLASCGKTMSERSPNDRQHIERAGIAFLESNTLLPRPINIGQLNIILGL